MNLGKALKFLASEMLEAAGDDKNYIHDPDHKKKPQGDYHETPMGWSKAKDKPAKPEQKKQVEQPKEIPTKEAPKQNAEKTQQQLMVEIGELAETPIVKNVLDKVVNSVGLDTGPNVLKYVSGENDLTPEEGKALSNYSLLMSEYLVTEMLRLKAQPQPEFQTNHQNNSIKYYEVSSESWRSAAKLLQAKFGNPNLQGPEIKKPELSPASDPQELAKKYQELQDFTEKNKVSNAFRVVQADNEDDFKSLPFSQFIQKHLKEIKPEFAAAIKGYYEILLDTTKLEEKAKPQEGNDAKINSYQKVIDSFTPQQAKPQTPTKTPTVPGAKPIKFQKVQPKLTGNMQYLLKDNMIRINELSELAGFKESIKNHPQMSDKAYKQRIETGMKLPRSQQQLKNAFLAHMNPANYDSPKEFQAAKLRVQKMPINDFCKLLASLNNDEEIT